MMTLRKLASLVTFCGWDLKLFVTLTVLISKYL